MALLFCVLEVPGLISDPDVGSYNQGISRFSQPLKTDVGQYFITGNNQLSHFFLIHHQSSNISDISGRYSV
jgi:hypothetical protein